MRGGGEVVRLRIVCLLTGSSFWQKLEFVHCRSGTKCRLRPSPAEKTKADMSNRKTVRPKLRRDRKHLLPADVSRFSQIMASGSGAL